MIEEKVCYLCGNKDFEKREGNVRDNSDLKVLECKNCSLVVLSSFDHINEKFYENDGMHGGQVNIKYWLNATKDDDKRRFRLLKNEIKGKKVLDFGCGNGGFLSFAKKSAQKVVGVELQKSMQEYYNSKGLKVYENINQIEEKFDYITVFHVLEHIKNPIVLLEKLSEKLNEGGKIIIEVPNSNDALLTVYKNNAFMNFTYWSCHLFLFNAKNLMNLAQKAGFKINYIKHVQRYGFANHLGWQIFKKPGGHKKMWYLNIGFLNKFYEKSLARIEATDTILMNISK